MDSEETPALGNALEFMRLLWSLAHGMQSRSKRMETALGVTGPQRLAVRILGRSPGMTAGARASAMCVHPSTQNGILRRLESRGLVEKKRDRTDGRKVLLVLTSAGKKLDGHQSGTTEAAVRRTLGRLDEAEVEVARKVLELLTEEIARTDR
jgi:DNA-binding MarR family transcriptional regulator